MLRSLDLTTEILRLRWLIAAETFQLCFARSIPPTKELRLKCRQLEWGLAARRFQLAYARHVQALNQKGFNPDQPRVPAGQPDGGQWTSGGNGAGNGAPRTETLSVIRPDSSPGKSTSTVSDRTARLPNKLSPTATAARSDRSLQIRETMPAGTSDTPLPPLMALSQRSRTPVLSKPSSTAKGSLSAKQFGPATVPNNKRSSNRLTSRRFLIPPQRRLAPR